MAEKGHGTGAHTAGRRRHTAEDFLRSSRARLLRSWCRSLIAFVALYLIVSRIALPRVASVIDARQNAIEGDLAAAQKLKDESDAALKAYETELASARSRAQAIGNETREKLNAASEAERKTLEDQLTAKLAAAEKHDRGDARDRDEQCPRHRRGCGRRDRAAADRRAARRQGRQQRRRCLVEGIGRCSPNRKPGSRSPSSS